MWLISHVVEALRSLPSRCLKGSVIAVVFGYSAVLGPACNKPSGPPTRSTVRFSLGAPSSMYGMLGEALHAVYQRRAPHIDLQLLPSTGSIDNVNAIQRGNADIGMAQAHVAYFAAMGQLSSAQGVEYNRLRGIAVLPLTPVILLAGRNSSIRHLNDLVGGRVGVGELGASIPLTLQMLFDPVGIKQDMFHAESISSDEAVGRIVAGRLDAAFVMGYSPLVDKALAAGARIVPLKGPSFDQLRRGYPFLRPTEVTAEGFGTPPVRTIGVDRVLIARSDFDEQLVYEFTNLFFESLRDLTSTMDSLRWTDVQLAPATPIPLHEGAARYYRIRELSR